LETTVGEACYAYSHFEMDCEWRYFLADHIRTEAGHGWGYIRQADAIDPRRDHSRPDPDFEHQYGLLPRVEHHRLQQRDLLSYIISGNLWPYGHCTAASIQSIQITTPKVLDFEERVVHAGEREHHFTEDSRLCLGTHRAIWRMADPAQDRRNRRQSRPRTVFDPPRREFLRKYFNVPLENVRKFSEWREYLYLNVLGFPLSPFTSRTGLRKSRSLQTLRDWCCEKQDDHSKQH
jgi:hypothetical protein